jgi:hypothetical protein
MEITHNEHEHTVTISRSNGTKLEFVYLSDKLISAEFTIALNDQEGNQLQEIPLSMEEAKELHSHLSIVLK